MMEIPRRVFRWLMGGRPMRLIGTAFADPVRERPVFYYRDQYGRAFMAYNRWGWFRVRASSDDPITAERVVAMLAGYRRGQG